ncbi:MAG: helix-turn-helix domain-containing protein [Burkholderiaceae bacterium]|nr:helix-turn-helix domain-containing protein [Burkholderiaceae bacterium]
MSDKAADADLVPPADGTQAIRRAAALLRALAQSGAGGEGTSLAALARSQGLPRSTAHRMLGALVDEGFIERMPQGPGYRMGPLIHELGLTSASSLDDVARWHPVVEAVARQTGVTTYLMRRSGVEAVCLIKADGHAVMRFVPVEVGQRRLLGVGAGATALLAALAPAQLERVLASIAPGLAPYPRLSPQALREAVVLTRRSGFAISQGTVVDDGFGMGITIPDGTAPPRLALSIAAHATMVTESRIKAWKAVLAAAVGSPPA